MCGGGVEVTSLLLSFGRKAAVGQVTSATGERATGGGVEQVEQVELL